MSSNASTPQAQHLAVLVHGMWGNPGHLAHVAKSLREKHGADSLHILVAKRNSDSFTYDGIEVGGERVCREIEDEIEKLAKRGQHIKKMSIVGYSMGGLVSRYAIGLLDAKGLFEKVEPVNFTTFASPHLGARSPLVGYHNHVWNVLGARTLSMSGRQLFLVDQFRDTGRPLLSVLADPNSIFMHGLAKFKRRTLYANIVNDRSAVYYTTGITKQDPFTDLQNIKINYLKGYNDVILDPEQPITPRDLKLLESTSFYARLTAGGQLFMNKVPFFLAMAFFIPIGSVAFLINSGFQSFFSSRRIRLHEQGRAGIETGTYRIPLLSNVREAVEDAYENLNASHGQEYLAAGDEEAAIRSSPMNRSSLLADSLAARESEKPVSSAASMTSLDEALSHAPAPKVSDDFPTLALAPNQFAMIQALDQVGWRKFPVHIHNSHHSHAAMIVRMQRSSMKEGKMVMRHWLDEEFIL